MQDAFKLHRKDDLDTSIEAAKLIHPNLGALQLQVLEYAIKCGPYGFTDQDLGDYFDNHGSTYRSRRSELTTDGIIIHSGARNRLKSGRQAVVWVYYKYHQPLVPEDDGQPDEAQEWADFDPEC
jgi:hypothetical protein